MPTSAQTEERIRRSVDVFIASVALALLAPLFVLIAAAILIECGRPVFFKQTRLGQGGRHFSIYKFRKFTTREAKVGLPLTMPDDARMSRIGGLLAKTKLDELPQFYNVLRGDMSLIGPRPESLDLADCFDDASRAILNHRPGILGPSQIAFRNESSLFPNNGDPTEFYRNVLFPAKARLDLAYYRRRNLYSDVRLLVLGILAVCGLASSHVKTTVSADVPGIQGRQI